MHYALAFLDFFGLSWFWVCLAAVFFCLELLFAGSAFFLAVGSAALVPALAAATFEAVTPLTSFGLYAAALVPATILWARYWRGRSRRGTGDTVGSGTLNNRTAGLAGNTAVIENDFRDGKGWIKVDGIFWPCECAEALAAGDKVRVVETDGILLKVIKTFD
jgi:membrane protein implicated in regulation of membrane protease activity